MERWLGELAGRWRLRTFCPVRATGAEKKGGSFKRPLIQKSTKVLPISILKLPRPLIQLPCRDEPATEGDFFGTADLQALAFLDRLDVGACLHEGIVGEFLLSLILVGLIEGTDKFDLRSAAISRTTSRQNFIRSQF